MIAKRVHGGGPAVWVIGGKIPARGDVGLFVVSGCAEEAFFSAGTLRGSGPAPFPEAFTKGEMFGDAEFAPVGVGFDDLGDDDFTGEAGAIG